MNTRILWASMVVLGWLGGCVGDDAAGVPGDRVVSSLNAAELQALCDEQLDVLASTPELQEGLCVFEIAFMFAFEPPAGDAAAQTQACLAQYDACLNQPLDFESDADSECTLIEARQRGEVCDATVDEVRACIDAAQPVVAAQYQELVDLFTCEDLVASIASGAQVEVRPASQSEVTSLEDIEECRGLTARCPGLNASQQDVEADTSPTFEEPAPGDAS